MNWTKSRLLLTGAAIASFGAGAWADEAPPLEAGGVTMAAHSKVVTPPQRDGCPDILNTYSSGYETGIGWTVSDGEFGLWGPANPFTTASDVTLCEIGYTGSHVTGTNQYTLWLLPDGGGCPADPANAIASWTIRDLGAFGDPVDETVVDASGICLDANTRYWLAVTADGGGTTLGAANWSSTDFLNRCNYNYDGTWTNFGNSEAACWRVTATQGCGGGDGDVLGVNWSGDTYLIDSTTGSASFLGASGFETVNSMAKDPVSHDYYAAAGADIVRIDPVTGGGVYVSTMNTITDARGMAFSPAGRLYVVRDMGVGNNDELWTVNVNTGADSFVGSIGFPGVQALEFDKFGTLYAWDCGSGGGVGDGLIRINPNTGVGTDVNPAIGGRCDEIQSMTFSPSGRLYGGNFDWYTINTATGALNLIGSGGLSDIRGMEWTADPFMTARGLCPGTITVRVENCTPFSRVAIEYSSRPGSFVIPGSFACAGITVNMGLPLLPGSPAFTTADANGVATASGPVPAGLCGRIRLQAIDATTCATSNVIIFP